MATLFNQFKMSVKSRFHTKNQNSQSTLKKKSVGLTFGSALLSIVINLLIPLICLANEPADSAVRVIPYPQRLTLTGDDFIFSNPLAIVLSKNHSAADEFTANELSRDLKNEWNIDATVTNKKGNYSIILKRQKAASKIGKQGYELSVDKNEITITSAGEDGLFYGTQTLLQLIQKDGPGYKVKGLKITDWPDIKGRAIHYDTKHHQDKLSYVKSFIKDLSRYKVNILVWEWEDKFAYPSHPEIGAPGAFTPKEIRELTEYARQYHIQIVPLVQGLGHASFILKWPQFAHLRELPASNFEFCPLKDGSYNLLFDLWKDAIEATPGSEYIHIGSDETYELGLCDQCKEKAKEIGKKGIYHLFSDKAAKYILSRGRKPMIWERPMGWIDESSQVKVEPNKGLVLTEDMGEVGVERARKAKALGYRVFFYDPNPGVVPLFLPYSYTEDENYNREPGCLEDSYNSLTEAARSGVFDGMIRTSWDDAGLHNQAWMLCFLTAAGFSWNGRAPALKDFKETFFKSYYGADVVSMDELFDLLNEGSYYFFDTFERKVWHYGDVGKTFLPDLPRGDALEYDPYWNRQNKEMINRSHQQLQKMNRALEIIEVNKKSAAKHLYDLEVFESCAKLIRHTCQTFLDLSELENAVKDAHEKTFVNRDSAYASLENARHIVENNLKRRTAVLNDLVATWEKTRLPKGMNTPEKKYFFQQDRTRHFANRRPDMDYLIYDEQLLDLEGWLEKLKAYMEKYKSNSFN